MDSGLFWNACHLDKGSLFLVASWDTAQLNNKQVDGLAEGLADLLRRLTGPGTWDRTVKSIVDEHMDLSDSLGFYGEIDNS